MSSKRRFRIWEDASKASARSRRRADHKKIDRNAQVERLSALEPRLMLTVFPVTNTNDAGAGSLRQAIQGANVAPGSNAITFSIPGGGVHTITPASALATITGSVIVDGNTQPGFSGTPLIEIAGQNAGTGVDGLGVNVSNVTIRGLAIDRFSRNGIGVSGSASNVLIAGNYLGTNAAGSAAAGNGVAGVNIYFGANAVTVGGTTAAARNVISGNLWGVLADGGFGPTRNVLVSGNFIGTNAAGTAAVPNTSHGVYVNTATAVTVGGSTAAGRNVISGNGADGLLVDNSGSAVVIGNWIGLAADGATRLGNLADGVNVSDFSRATIGGSVAGGNVISGNGDATHPFAYGVHLAAPNNLVAGNFIGLNAAGNSAVMNQRSGVFIDNSSGNTIGSTTSFGLNVISGNGEAGVYIEYPGATGNLVLHNEIGPDAAGTTNVGGDPYAGVAIDGAGSNTIGGNSAAAENLISGNGGPGVLITDLANSGAANGNVIIGDVIGLNGAGGRTLGNFGAGVAVRAGANNQVGGTAAGTGNTISGNVAAGVVFSGTDTGSVLWLKGQNTTDDTYLGHDGAAPNGVSYAPGVPQVGGQAFSFNGTNQAVSVPDSPALRTPNVTLEAWVYPTRVGVNSTLVSKEPSASLTNFGYGLRLRSDNTFWFAIGADGNSTFAASPAVAAVNTWFHLVGTYDGATIRLYVNGALAGSTASAHTLNSTAPLTIGGQPDGATAEYFQGRIDEITLYDRALSASDVTALQSGDGSSVKGPNRLGPGVIGLDGSGFIAEGNGGAGVSVQGAANIAIGTLGAGSLVVSSNSGPGIILSGSGSSNVAVQHAILGLDIAQDASRPNSGQGIVAVAGAKNLLIGNTLGSGNVIASNGVDGISIGDASVSNVLIEGNFIGTNSSGAAFGSLNGPGILTAGVGVTIGGTAAGAANVIAYNASSGVLINSNGPTILENSIYSNLGLGIGQQRRRPEPGRDADRDGRRPGFGGDRRDHRRDGPGQSHHGLPDRALREPHGRPLGLWPGIDVHRGPGS